MIELRFWPGGWGEGRGMGRGQFDAAPTGPAIAGPQPCAPIDAHLTITVGGELEEGRAFFGTDAVREFVSP